MEGTPGTRTPTTSASPSGYHTENPMMAAATMAALAMQQQYGAASAGLPAGLLDPARLISPLDPLYAAIHQKQNQEQKTVVQEETFDEIGRIAKEGVHETVSEEVFSNYRHVDILPGCHPHPGDIVEAGMLASLSMPEPSYPLGSSLPKEMITSGKLSSLQLEGILYGCQRHQMILPNQSRAGFFIGDAAGVGKGRQISGMILDNFVRGRRKHVWFSISTDLVVDARRDFSDLGCFINVIEGCQQLDKETRVFGLPSNFKEGVIFSTYATLVSSVQRGKSVTSTRQTRLQQLVDWCGGESFEGCLVFDECHKAKNFVPGKETASTKVALAVAHIQKLLPRARVLYCSATGVTDVKNMAFMERLGLWGEGAPFKGFDEFIKTVERKGLGVAEMLAMEMKSSGMYVSRGLSYRAAEFTTVEIELTKEQMKMYDTAAHVCLGIKVPGIVAEAKAALENGQCVVIGLQTTGEASMESEANSKKGPLKGFVSLCREILVRFIQQHFPTNIEGQLGVGESPVDDWCTTAKQMLTAFAQQIPLPDSPLDEIIDKLGGPDQVAEMTGRRARIVRKSPNDTPQYELRDANDNTGFLESLNVKERNQFMNGPKRVAIISDAASTGISLHADLRASNQCRRVHLTIELPWSADKAVQQLGRSHRSNQSSGPLYKLMTTSLGGERRFAATVARRLQSLGALTKGDRRAATGADLAEFNFDTLYGRLALRAMYTAVCQQQLVSGVALSSVWQKQDGIFTEFNDEILDCLNQMCMLEMDVLRNQPKVKDAVASDVGRFLNRILGLSVAKQQLMFNYFMKCLDAQVDAAKKEGKYNEGLIDLQASSVEMLEEPRLVFQDASNSHNPTKHVSLNVDRGMSWDAAVARLENHPGSDNGFYRSKREMFGRKLCILATKKDTSTHAFTISRPNTGVSNFDIDRMDLMNKYTHISQDEAENIWKEDHESSQKRCVHGPHCKTGAACAVGSRCYTVHLLCGGIVTLMTLLETTIARYGARLNLTKAESTLRVVRAQLNSGERIVGIRYPEPLIPLVEQTLKEQKMIENAQLQQSTLIAASQGLPVPAAAAKITKKHVTREAVTSVCEKSLRKATTPPVTIRNFFKSVSKETMVTQLAEQCAKPVVASPAGSDQTKVKNNKVTKRAGISNFMGAWASGHKSAATPDGKDSPTANGKDTATSGTSGSAGSDTTGTSASAREPASRHKKTKPAGKKRMKIVSDSESDSEGDESWSEGDSGAEETTADNTAGSTSPRLTRSTRQQTKRKLETDRSDRNDRAKRRRSSHTQLAPPSGDGDNDDDDDFISPQTEIIRSKPVPQALEERPCETNTLINQSPKPLPIKSENGPKTLSACKSRTAKSQSGGAKRSGLKSKPSSKQVKLTSAFAQPEKNKTKQCPICSKLFGATTLNAEINDHIDNCLIE